MSNKIKLMPVSITATRDASAAPVITVSYKAVSCGADDRPVMSSIDDLATLTNFGGRSWWIQKDPETGTIDVWPRTENPFDKADIPDTE